MLQFILIGLLFAFIILVKSKSKNAPAYYEIETEEGIYYCTQDSPIETGFTAELHTRKAAA